MNKTYCHVVHLSGHFFEQLQKKKYIYVYLKITNEQPRFCAVLITSSVFSTYVYGFIFIFHLLIINKQDLKLAFKRKQLKQHNHLELRGLEPKLVNPSNLEKFPWQTKQHCISVYYIESQMCFRT